MKKGIILALICCFMLAGCATNKPVESVSVEDRLMLSFSPASDNTVAQSSAQSLALNYVYHLSRGEYDAALELCYIPDGVLFDETALQRAVLADKFGRGEISFYVAEDYGTEVSVEYDLSASGATSTYNKTVNVCRREDGLYYIDLEASDYIAMGALKFKVPQYVDAYINGVCIPKEFLDSNFCYNITRGIAKLPGEVIGESTTVDEDGNTVETTGTALTLTLKSKFGIEQTYPLSFMGTLEKSKQSVNDEYYKTSTDMTEFYIDIPREVRESALEYIKTDVVPVLMNDFIAGNSWDIAAIRNTFGADTKSDAMFPNYYKTARSFADATKDTEGKYFFYNISTYNYEIAEKHAENEGIRIEVSDWNVLDLYITCDYNYLYTAGSDSTERNEVGSLRGLVQLSVDDNGKWYVHYLDETLFKLGLA